MKRKLAARLIRNLLGYKKQVRAVKGFYMMQLNSQAINLRQKAERGQTIDSEGKLEL